MAIYMCRQNIKVFQAELCCFFELNAKVMDAKSEIFYYFWTTFDRFCLENSIILR